MRKFKIERTIQIKGYPSPKSETAYSGLSDQETEFFFSCLEEIANTSNHTIIENEKNYIEFETERALVSYEAKEDVQNNSK